MKRTRSFTLASSTLLKWRFYRKGASGDEKTIAEPAGGSTVYRTFTVSSWTRRNKLMVVTNWGHVSDPLLQAPVDLRTRRSRYTPWARPRCCSLRRRSGFADTIELAGADVADPDTGDLTLRTTSASPCSSSRKRTRAMSRRRESLKGTAPAC